MALQKRRSKLKNKFLNSKKFISAREVEELRTIRDMYDEYERLTGIKILNVIVEKLHKEESKD